MRRTTGPLALLLVIGVQDGVLAQAGPRPCGPTDLDPGLHELRDRTLASNALALYAIERYGPPTGCRGSIETEFEGRGYGMVVFSFNGGPTLEVETLPPESSIVTLRDPSGFADDGAVRLVIERYVDAVGVSIDWTAPVVMTSHEGRTETFWAADAGLNASACFEFEGGVLVAVGFGMAL